MAQGELEAAQTELAAKIIILGQQQTQLDELKVQLAAEQQALATATAQL